MAPVYKSFWRFCTGGCLRSGSGPRFREGRLCRRGAWPQALMGSVDRGLIRLAGLCCPMSWGSSPSIRRSTGPRARRGDASTPVHPSHLSGLRRCRALRPPPAWGGSPAAASSSPRRCAPSCWRAHRRRPCAFSRPADFFLGQQTFSRPANFFSASNVTSQASRLARLPANTAIAPHRVMPRAGC
jgi:hypothetical protein